MHQHSADGGAEAAHPTPARLAPLATNFKTAAQSRVRRRWSAFVAFVALLTLVSMPGAAQDSETSTTAAQETTSSVEGSSTTDAGSETTTASTDSTEATTSTSEGTDTTDVVTTAASTAPTTASPTTAAPTTAAPTTAAPSPSTTGSDRDQLDVAESAKEDEVDLATAQLSDLEKTLAETESRVSVEVAKVDIAKYEFEVAQALVDAAADQVQELEVQVARLEAGLENQAIQSFKDNDLSDPIMLGQDPTDALRMQAMLAKATQSDIDYANLLDATKEELLGMRREAEMAAAEAERLRNDSESTLEDLQEEQDRWRNQVVQANDRIDYLLAEQLALESLGADVDAGLDIDLNKALIERLGAVEVPSAPANTSSSGSSGTVTDDDIVEAANGIMVHRDIVDDVRQLLADAEAAGVELRGGGYRSPAGQIAVRKKNCGTTNYAIYEMPSSQCRPPTARPGRSMHEQGKAIDFTYNGTIIRYRSGPAWEWLKANASKYGLYNLASEPWHWSTNGR
jgi:hypothetical protein